MDFRQEIPVGNVQGDEGREEELPPLRPVPLLPGEDFPGIEFDRVSGYPGMPVGYPKEEANPSGGSGEGLDRRLGLGIQEQVQLLQSYNFV